MFGRGSNKPSTQMSTQILKDTTFRSVIFGMRDVEVVPTAEGQMILRNQVEPGLFNSYILTLNTMAQLSRAVYCDSGILREILLSPVFGTIDSNAVNSIISQITKQYSDLRRAPSSYANSKEGRPMKSYVIAESSQIGNGLARYVSTPSDLTFAAVPGNICKILKPSDLVISFKGSSTIKNFKHDLYSQFTPMDLGTIMPLGTKMSSTSTKNYVPSSFIKPINNAWSLLKKTLDDYKPTRLFITGHSLGGAYATLFGFIMAECRAASFPGIQSIHIVTFGAPTLLGDVARNTFNAHLDSGVVTLDRVVSYGRISKLFDFIPKIPVGFSHPGFQPLRTEFYPEKKTGRAYHIETIEHVYQIKKQFGGLFGIGDAKGKYEKETKQHMPNKVVVRANKKLTQGFTHAEYFDIDWLSALRLARMKNPGFKGSNGVYNTFVADIFDDGIRFNYVTGEHVEIAEEPTSISEEPFVIAEETPSNKASSGGRRTFRRKISNKSKTSKHKQLVRLK
jgi:hypothetical protein